MMTNKEIAERIDIAMGSTEYDGHGGVFQQLRALRNELDPPKPEPGTVVWWRHVPKDGVNGVIVDWTTGVAVVDNNAGIYSQYGWYAWDEIEWKPARILKPGQVAVDRADIEIAARIIDKPGTDIIAAKLRNILDRDKEAGDEN